MIRNNHFDAAVMLWEREYAGGVNEARNGGRPLPTVAADSLIIARTFVDRAEALELFNPVKANTAARHAHIWVRRAAMDLPADQEDLEVQDIEDRRIVEMNIREF